MAIYFKRIKRKKPGDFCKTKCFHALSSALNRTTRKITINTVFISSHVYLNVDVANSNLIAAREGRNTVATTTSFICTTINLLW